MRLLLYTLAILGLSGCAGLGIFVLGNQIKVQRYLRRQGRTK